MTHLRLVHRRVLEDDGFARDEPVTLRTAQIHLVEPPPVSLLAKLLAHVLHRDICPPLTTCERMKLLEALRLKDPP